MKNGVRGPAVIMWAPLLVLVGCANPAEDKPVAEINEPVKTEDSAPAEDATTYTIADSSALTWIGSKVTGKHDGGFKEFSGTVTVSGDNIEDATIDITIDATSIWSDNDKLTGHLKSADFFEVETYPTAAFKSTNIAKTEKGYNVTGNLTLHGVEKSITFPAQIDLDGDTLTSTAEFVITRTDFGINYKGKPDDLIREEVVIRFDITAEAEVENPNG